MSLNLDPSTWGELPSNAANQSGGWTWPSTYATTSYANGTLTLSFDGNNRQRAIIPLSSAQVEELLSTAEAGVTFRIVGTAKDTSGAVSTATFRLHLGNPSGTANWNGTNTVDNTTLTSLVQYATFSGNKTQPNLGWFMIQAMYDGAADPPAQSGFPEVIVTVESITVDIGDTSS